MKKVDNYEVYLLRKNKLVIITEDNDILAIVEINHKDKESVMYVPSTFPDVLLKYFERIGLFRISFGLIEESMRIAGYKEYCILDTNTFVDKSEGILSIDKTSKF